MPLPRKVSPLYFLNINEHSRHLTLYRNNGIFYGYGEMSEWFKEPVLKTGDAATHHGFESHSLRQTENAPPVQADGGDIRLLAERKRKR